MKSERKVGVYNPQEKQQCSYLTDSVVAETRILTCRDANLWRSKIWTLLYYPIEGRETNT